MRFDAIDYGLFRSRYLCYMSNGSQGGGMDTSPEAQPSIDPITGDLLSPTQESEATPQPDSGTPWASAAYEGGVIGGTLLQGGVSQPSTIPIVEQTPEQIAQQDIAMQADVEAMQGRLSSQQQIISDQYWQTASKRPQELQSEVTAAKESILAEKAAAQAQGRLMSDKEKDRISNESLLYAQQQKEIARARGERVRKDQEYYDEFIRSQTIQSEKPRPISSVVNEVITSDYVKIGDTDYQIARYRHELVDNNGEKTGKIVDVEIFINTKTDKPELYSVDKGVKLEIDKATERTINLPASQVELINNISEVAKTIEAKIAEISIPTQSATAKPAILTEDEIAKIQTFQINKGRDDVEFSQWLIDKGYVKDGKFTNAAIEMTGGSAENISGVINSLRGGYYVETGKANEAGIASAEMQAKGFPEVLVQGVTQLDPNHIIGSISTDYRNAIASVEGAEYDAKVTPLTEDQKKQIEESKKNKTPLPPEIATIVGKLGRLFITQVDASPLNDKFDVATEKLGSNDYTVITWWHEFYNPDQSKYIEQLKLYVDDNGTPLYYRIGDNIPLKVSQIENYSCTGATCRWDEKLEVKTTAQIIKEQGLNFASKPTDSIKTEKQKVADEEVREHNKRVEEDLKAGKIIKPEIPPNESPFLNDLQKGATNNEIKAQGYLGEDGKPITDAEIESKRDFLNNNTAVVGNEGIGFISDDVVKSLPQEQQIIIARGENLDEFVKQQFSLLSDFITKDDEGKEQFDVIGALKEGVENGNSVVYGAIKAIFPQKQLDIIAKTENNIVTPYGIEKYSQDQRDSGKTVIEIKTQLKEAGYSDDVIKVVDSIVVPDNLKSDKDFKSMSRNELKTYAVNNPDDPRIQWLDPARIKTGDISAKTAISYADAVTMMGARDEGFLKTVEIGAGMKLRDFDNALDSMQQMIATKLPEGMGSDDKSGITNAMLALIGLPVGIGSMVATGYLINREGTDKAVKDVIKVIDVAKQKVTEFNVKEMIEDWKGKNVYSIALQLKNNGVSEDVAMNVARATTEAQSFGMYAGNFVLDVAKTLGAIVPLTLIGSQLKFADGRMPSSAVDMAGLIGGMVMFPIVFAGDSAKNLLAGKYVQTAGEITGLGLTLVFGVRDIVRIAKSMNRVLPDVLDFTAVSIEATLGITKYDMKKITPSTARELENKVLDFMNSRATKESILDAFQNGMTIKLATPDGIIDIKITPMNAIRPDFSYSVTDMASPTKGGALLDDIYNRGGILSKEVPTGDVGTSIYMSPQPALNFMGQQGVIIGFIRSPKDLKPLPKEIIDKLDWNNLDAAKTELARLYNEGKLEAGIYPVMKWFGKDKVPEWEMWTTPGFKTYNIPLNEIPKWAKEEGVPTAVTYINSPVNAGAVKVGDKIPVYWQITENALNEGRRLYSLKEKYLAELLSIPSELRKLAYGFRLRKPALETDAITSTSPITSKMGVAEVFRMNESFLDDYMKPLSKTELKGDLYDFNVNVLNQAKAGDQPRMGTFNDKVRENAESLSSRLSEGDIVVDSNGTSYTVHIYKNKYGNEYIRLDNDSGGFIYIKHNGKFNKEGLMTLADSKVEKIGSELVTRNPQPMERSITGGRYAEKRVGVDIIPYDSVNKRIYLIRSKGDNVPEGVYSFPGGGTDPKSAVAEYGKTWESNALGQLRHEVGIDVPLSEIFMLGIFNGRRKLYSLDGARVLEVDAKGKPMNFRSEWNKGDPEIIEGIMWDGKPEIRTKVTLPEIDGLTSKVDYADFKVEADKSLGKAYLKDYSIPKNASDLADITFYLNKDKTAGYGINNRTGEIVNLFNNGVSGTGAILYAESILRGGKWENHYEWQQKRGTKYYEQFGFKEVGRTKDRNGIDIVFTEYGLPKRDINTIIDYATNYLNGKPMWADRLRDGVKITKPENIETYVQKVQLMPAQYYMLEGFLAKHPELGITMENVEMYKGTGMEVLINNADKNFAKRIKEGTMLTENEITRIGIERQKLREKLVESNLTPTRISGIIAELMSKRLIIGETSKGTSLYSALIPFITPESIPRFIEKVKSIVAEIEAKAVEAKAKGADYEKVFKNLVEDVESKILSGEIELLPQKDWIIAPKEKKVKDGYEVEVLDEPPKVANPMQNVYATLAKDIALTTKEAVLQYGGDIIKTLQDRSIASVFKENRDALYYSIIDEYKKTYGKYPQRLEQLSIIESVRNVMDEANSRALDKVKDAENRKQMYSETLSNEISNAINSGKLNKDVVTVIDTYRSNIEKFGRVIESEYQTAYKNQAGYWAMIDKELQRIYEEALEKSTSKGSNFSAIYEALLDENKPLTRVADDISFDHQIIKNRTRTYAADNVFTKYPEYNNAYVENLYSMMYNRKELSIIGDYITQVKKISDRTGYDFITLFEETLWKNSEILFNQNVNIVNVIRNARNYATEKALPEIMSKIDNRLSDWTPRILESLATKEKIRQQSLKLIRDRKLKIEKEIIERYDEIPYRAESGNVRGIPTIRVDQRVTPVEARRILTRNESQYRTIYPTRRATSDIRIEPTVRDDFRDKIIVDRAREPIRDIPREPPRIPPREPTREYPREPTRIPPREPIRVPPRVPPVYPPTKKPPRIKDSIIDGLTKKQLDSAIAWKQGKVYRMWVEPYNQKSMIVTYDPIPGVEYHTGVGSAYRSVTTKYGQIPRHLRYEMGIQIIDFKPSGDPNKPSMDFTENYNRHGGKSKSVRTGVVKNGLRKKPVRQTSQSIIAF